MMYLIPDPVVTKQVSGIAESSPSRPSPSKSYQHAEKSSPSLLSFAKSPSAHRRRYYSSDEEDDSRDRQSHWKRIKTRPDDNPRGSTRNLIRYTERDYENSPPRIRLQAPPQSPKPRPSANPRPGHRMVVLKGIANEKDVRLRRFGHESEVRTGSGSKAWDGAVGMRMSDGGTASTNIDLGGNKRKQDLMSAFGNASRSSLMMSERSMVVREKLTARRTPLEKGYEFRVSDREVGEFVDGEDDDSLFLEDSRQFYDDYPPRSMSGSDLREILNRRGRVEEAMSREARVYGDYRIPAERGGFDAGVRVRRVEFDVSAGNGQVQGSTVRKILDLGRSSRSGNDERASVGTGGLVASVGAKSEQDMESERRQEKRERWAEKERDLEKELEKENMLKASQQQAKVKSVTVVDYSHKFALAKAPIAVPAKPVETDAHRLCQRQKQIDYGKNTLGYERYTDMIPRYQRTKAHPRTPDIRQVCSKRSWDGQIRKWRRLLHEFDPPKDEDEADPEQMLVLRREPGRSTEYVEDTLMDMQAEYVEDQHLKIYEGWSDDEC